MSALRSTADSQEENGYFGFVPKKRVDVTGTHWRSIASQRVHPICDQPFVACQCVTKYLTSRFAVYISEAVLMVKE